MSEDEEKPTKPPSRADCRATSSRSTHAERAAARRACPRRARRRLRATTAPAASPETRRCSASTRPSCCIIAVVALVVIGPKDLPRVMRTVGHWVGQARGMARHFRSGIDTMMREAELEDMEKKWREENERIMRAVSARCRPG